MASVSGIVVGSGRIAAGKLLIRNRRQFDEQIRALKDGWEVEIEIKRRRAARSMPHNAWYWGVIVEILSQHTGYTADEMHDVLKAKFIPKRLAICDHNGEVQDEFVIGGSTRLMNTSEFSEYCEAIRQWAAEQLDVYIPDPGEAR